MAHASPRCCMQGHSLELSWLTPPGWMDYKSGPLNFISHLLGHEGEAGGGGDWDLKGDNLVLSDGMGCGVGIGPSPRTLSCPLHLHPPDIPVLLPPSCRRGITADPSTPPLQLPPSPSLLPPHRPSGEGSLFTPPPYPPSSRRGVPVCAPQEDRVGFVPIGRGEWPLDQQHLVFLRQGEGGVSDWLHLVLLLSPGILAFPCAQRWSSPRPEGARVVTLSPPVRKAACAFTSPELHPLPLQVELTEEGQQHVAEIGELVFK